MMSDLYDTSRYSKSKHEGLQQQLELNLGFPHIPRKHGLIISAGEPPGHHTLPEDSDSLHG